MLSQIPQARTGAPAAAQAASVDIERLLEQARAAEDEGNPEAAVLAFSRALSIDGRHLGALCGLGELLLRIESFAEALVCFDKALALDSRVIIFDEPTASLSPHEADRLFDIMRMQAERGESFHGWKTLVMAAPWRRASRARVRRRRVRNGE